MSGRTAAIVLAAGSSTRLGEPKQLVKLGKETLLERSVRVATKAMCSPVIVVLGALAERIRRDADLHGARIIENAGWSEGMASSIRCGVAALEEVEGVVVMTCDMPAVTATHLRALVRSGAMTATSYAGRRGVPAYFPQSIFAMLLQLQGDAGARELLRIASAIELPGGELDIDTEHDLKAARERFG